MNASPQQQAILEAVASTKDHLSVRALAGTGKTTTIEMANKSLASPPLNIAFNALIRKEFNTRMPASTNHTFNSFGHFLVGRAVGRIDFSESKVRDYLNSKGFDYRDSPDGLAMVNWLRNMGYGPTEHSLHRSDVSGTVAAFDEIRREEEFEVSDEFVSALPTTLLDLLKSALSGCIDYGDQVWLPVIMKLELPYFGTVFVDEAQDINALQHSLIVRLARRNRLVVVGDPHQAIYGFRGSVGEGMSILEKDLNATTLPLSVTWRCPKAVVKYAQQFVPDYTAADGAPEGEVVELDEWGPDRDTFPTGAAVLCRNNAPLLSLAMMLISEHIPCTIRGTDIGKNLSRLASKIIKQGRCQTIADLDRAINNWAMGEVNAKPKKAEQTIERRDCLLAVLSSCNSIHQFGDVLARIFSDKAAAITLSTIHKAKGLEWDTVFFLDRWRIPSKFATKPEELQQEQNLVYVGATRAKRSLRFINAG